MEALSSLEIILQAFLGAAALGVATWSAWRSIHVPASAPKTRVSAGNGNTGETGEIAWSVVAVVVLAGVAVAVGFGGAHGV